MKPILFNTEMVKAVLDGRKTQTRRVIKENICFKLRVSPRDLIDCFIKKCPYGKIGDKIKIDVYAKDKCPCCGYTYGDKKMWGDHKLCNIYKITLEITDIRVERVQDITFDDCFAEGCEHSIIMHDVKNDLFMPLWDSINKKRGYGWEVNPYVWVVEFKVVK